MGVTPAPTTDVRTMWGPRIAEARKNAGLTQVRLAAASDCDPQTISRVERGDGMSLDTYLAIAAKLGLNLLGDES